MPNYNEESLNSVPVQPLQDAVIASGMTYGQIALRCGWIRNDRERPTGDSTRLKRRIGMSPYTTRGKKHTQLFTSYENAVLIARAINADPIDVGI